VSGRKKERKRGMRKSAGERGERVAAGRQSPVRERAEKIQNREQEERVAKSRRGSAAVCRGGNAETVREKEKRE